MLGDNLKSGLTYLGLKLGHDLDVHANMRPPITYTGDFAEVISYRWDPIT